MDGAQNCVRAQIRFRQTLIHHERDNSMALKIETAAYAVDVGERNDCAVRAVATAACVPYAAAYSTMRSLGRKPGDGTPWHVLDAAISFFAPGTVQQSARVDFQGEPTLAQFAAAHPRGHFVVCTVNRREAHAYALIDGAVHDHAKYSWPRDSAGYVTGSPHRHAGARRRVRRFWQLI
jgi:hypothetical protein